MSEAVENTKVHAQQSEQKPWEISHGLVIWPNSFGCDDTFMSDMFLRHEPKTENQQLFYDKLVENIKEGCKIFRVAKIDPSITAEGKIFYEKGSEPAHVLPTKLEKVAREYAPEKNSRLGSEQERIFYIAQAMRTMYNAYYHLGKFSVSDLWSYFCDGAFGKLGAYRDSEVWYFNKIWEAGTGQPALFEWGKEYSTVFCDWAGTYKIGMENNKLILMGGCRNDYSFEKPVTNLEKIENITDIRLYNAVPWITMDI